jgi:hypothetical protein
MSDGRTEAMRGTYFSDKKLIPTDDPQTGELNPYYKELTGKNNPLDIKHMPNQKWHRIISFLKSGIRILGYAFIPFNLVAATIILIISEIVGIIEELV